MRDLLDLPQVHREAARGGRGDVDDLRAIEAQAAGALREVAVVTDVDANARILRVEDGVAEIAGAEVELLPEALHLRNVRLAILAQVAAVGVDHGRRVVVDARLL